MLEVNVLDIQKAKYVENVIAVRDRLAFTCVNKEDMNKLVRCLRESQNLCINIVHSTEGENLSQFQPRVPIERLHGGLSHSLDIVRLENLKGQMSDVRKSLRNYDQQIQTYQNELVKLNEKLNVTERRVGNYRERSNTYKCWCPE
ncbi:hypothetical protein NQ317_006943 [Molorchus minor]|uniref:Uncharacterized protein n=1 Tax=Molorchus minor TaxID=1323400 RepID=A0ABQ9JP41_9CUCU|nr:hypothetical protein NQ317_006943 [Molorchus minor]